MAFSLAAERLQDSDCTEEYEKRAEWNLSHYTDTTFQTRQSSDTHPSNTSAVPGSAAAYTKQPTSHCMGMRRGREKHV